MTGRYGFRTGWNNLIGLPGAPDPDSPKFDIGASEVTFADVLKAKGYATALAGKWQLPGRAPALIHDCGFDEYLTFGYKRHLPKEVKHTGRWEIKGVLPARFWHPSVLRNGEYVPTQPSDYGPDLYTDFLIDFIRRHRDQPFLAYYPMCLTHKPWEPTPSLDLPGQKTPGGLKHNVEYMDHLVGRIVEALDRFGLRKNTIVIFTGDNGTKGAGKGETTELGVRVPMIANCPGTLGAGVVSDELVDLSDVLPTLAEFAGAPLPKNRVIDGRSFTPILRGEAGKPREWIFSFRKRKRLLRDKRWLMEGDGRLFDCGDSRDGTGYKEVTQSGAPEVIEARERFDSILARLPRPKQARRIEKTEGMTLDEIMAMWGEAY